MDPIDFPEANTHFTPPADMDESQVQTIHAYTNKIAGGNLDGAQVVVTAWRPSPEEIEDIVNGAPVFLSVLGGLPPHYIATSFEAATNL